MIDLGTGRGLPILTYHGFGPGRSVTTTDTSWFLETLAALDETGYRAVDLAEWVGSGRPEVPCGFSLERARREAAVLPRHPDWPRLRAVKSKNVFVTDGNQYFNRPGPRLVDSLEILAQILWPKLFPAPSPNKSWSRF